MPSHTDLQAIQDVWQQVYAYSRAQQYKGYNKHDGLNSPILKAVLGWSKWPRMVAIQGIMRFPVNLRPLLFVPKTYNPKGLSLFIRGLLFRYEETGQTEFLDEAKQLLDILLTIKVKSREDQKNYSGIAWGYHYPWQDPGFFAPTNTPNAVVTAFVCNAFIHAYCVTQNRDYLGVVAEAIKFFMNDLTVLKDTPEELCLSYMPMPMTMRVMDVSILIGTVIAQYEKHSGDTTYHDKAGRLVRYVVRRQTSEGAWFYTDPPQDSHIVHDNYHTGFILDALWTYRQVTGDASYDQEYQLGLKFYADKLFMDDGAPKWMSDKQYPYDVHGAAQGVITFSRHANEYPGLAKRIAGWAIKNLYSGRGRFYYQKNSWYTKRFTLLRWCNGWMGFALANLLYYEVKNEKN